MNLDKWAQESAEYKNQMEQEENNQMMQIEPESNLVQKSIEVAKTIDATVDKYSGYAREFANIAYNYKQVETQRDIELAKFERDKQAINVELEKVKVVEKAIDKNFSQRDRQIDVAEKVVNTGLERNDLDTVIAGLKYMTDTVTKSPLEGLGLNKPQQIDYNSDDVIDL